jgi:hypothetical protein
MNPATFNGIFMIARTLGLIAHVIEEQTGERPMRRIDPVNHGYDGAGAAGAFRHSFVLNVSLDENY